MRERKGKVLSNNNFGRCGKAARKDMICYFLLFAISPTTVRTKPRMQVIMKIFQGKYAGAGEMRISIQSICA
jgi:hypothetical protein